MGKAVFLKSVKNILPQKLINLFWHLPKAFLAVCFYRFPARNLTVIGVTGTDGKTTTATLIYEIFKKAGKKVAFISSVSAKIGNDELPTGLHVTTPDPWELQRLLRKIADESECTLRESTSPHHSVRGAAHIPGMSSAGHFRNDKKYVILESTSHGLDQYRLFGCNFVSGVVTNVTHEHLDYHKSYKAYLEAKARLFGRVKYSVLNKDDKSFAYFKKAASGKITTYGLKDADFTPQNFSFKTALLGEYNKLNCLAAAAAAAAAFGISKKNIKRAIFEFEGVVGRAQEIKNDKGFRVFIDFAHTPNALKNILKTAKIFKPRRLIVVFGCAGLRDRSKRPMMGRIAGEIADITIVTAEDPRTEDVVKISNQIVKGLDEVGVREIDIKNAFQAEALKKNIFIRQPDRKRAIKLAVQIAMKGDIVLCCGKGHEQSMCFDFQESPWSEETVVKEALEAR